MHTNLSITSASDFFNPDPNPRGARAPPPLAMLVDFSAWRRRWRGMFISVYSPIPACFTLYFDIRPVHKWMWMRKHAHWDCRCVIIV